MFRDLKKYSNTDLLSMSLGMFFGSFKKGSKHCRKILMKGASYTRCVTGIDTVVNFFNLVSVPVQTEDEIENAHSLWSITNLPNKFREFLFKFFNNRLGLNSRTINFGGETRFCTFCVLENMPLVDESFKRLFYSCYTVRLIHARIESILDIGDNKKMWFGFPSGVIKNNFYCLFLLSIQFFIWKAKLSSKLPNANYVLGESVQLMDNLSNTNGNIFLGRDNYNCVLSRNWDLL